MSHQWKERVRPVRLETRYEFTNYDALRDFLDAAAEVSESEGLYPDMGFGKDYVNATIHLSEGESELGDLQHRLATAFDALISDTEIKESIVKEISK